MGEDRPEVDGQGARRLSANRLLPSVSRFPQQAQVCPTKRRLLLIARRGGEAEPTLEFRGPLAARRALAHCDAR